MTLTKFGFIALCSIVLGLVVYGYVQNGRHQRELAALRNTLAARDQTIEVQKGVYERLTITSKNLESLLDSKDKEVALLKEQLKDSDEEWLTASKLALKWKKAYEAAIAATQTEEPPTEPGGVARKRVEFTHDFGYIGVKGHTLTDPPEAWVSINQNRPLRVVVAVSQDKDRQWHTYATSSEENVAVDLELASVNPYLFNPKWYEKISVNASVGMGDGILMGLGLSYRFRQFDLGPAVWVAGDGSLSKFYGANVAWRPFLRE